MNYILFATALNLQITYPDQAVCEQALTNVKAQDESAFCIPAGVDKSDQMFDQMFDMIKKMQALDNKTIDQT